MAMKNGYMAYFENKKGAKISLGYVSITDPNTLGIMYQKGRNNTFQIGTELEKPIDDGGITYFYSFDQNKVIELAKEYRDKKFGNSQD